MASFAFLLAVLAGVSATAYGQVVGRSCTEATECGRGAYCDSLKRCRCLFSYISSSGYCLEKVNPDESGCANNVQCSGVWPGAYCSSGTCKCPGNRPAFTTRDGPVCLVYGSCPVNGNYKLRENNVIVSCTFGLDASCLTPTYECICSQQNCIDPAGASAFCCPTRAWACHEPLHTGSGGGGGGTRYYFNSATRSCQQFRYSGSGGNANNFASLAFCESYCLTGCKRGHPQYTAPTAPAVKESIQTCNSLSTDSNDCATNYDCSDTGKGVYCCPSVKHVCCTNCNAVSKGGVQYINGLTAPTTAYDAGIANGDGRTYTRYYYNSGLGYCTTFTWLGQGGNFNNFGSRSACELFCSTSLCDAGQPLKDGDGITNMACSSSSGCPTSHTCTSSVCCPTKQTVCSQPLNTGGPCNSIATRYWYNGATGNCQEFTFTGCNGNDNNFASYSDCTNFCSGAGMEPQCPQGKGARDTAGNYIKCGTGGVANMALCPGAGRDHTCLFDGSTYGCCPTQTYTCSLSYDSGTSCVTSTTVSRWYYNSATRTCSTFAYGGCDGNSNNFATQQDCTDYCQTGGCPNGGTPYMQNGVFLTCGSVACPSTHFCTTVSLGSITRSYTYCCPTRRYICELPRNAGVACGVGTITRYYFDSNTKQCLSFQFNGCSGSRNNFATLLQCRNYCYSADCPEGQTALVETSSGTITACTGSCRGGYRCVASRMLGQSICCGSPAPAGSCPADRPSAYIDPLTTTVMNCIPNLPATCPTNNICHYAVSQSNYFCCGFGANVCPNGGSPFVNAATNLALECTPGLAGACSSAGSQYTCQIRTGDIGGVQSTRGTCCSPGPVDVCGSGYTVTLLNGVPARCNPSSANVCPAPATCRLSPGQSNIYHCCTLTGTTTAPAVVCNGQSPYVVNRAPVICNNGMRSTNCPSPYSCILYSPTNVYYCCGAGGGAGGCPAGYTVSQAGGVVRRCSPSTTNSCGVGGLCQFVTQYSGYVCCLGGGINPGPTPNNDRYCTIGTYQRYLGTQLPVACQPGGIACQTGYSCRPSRTGQGSICCTNTVAASPTLSGTSGTSGTSGRHGCPGSHPTPLMYNNNLPLGCSAASAPCPSGYTCLPSLQYQGSQCCQ